jgi:uncharacterized phage protein gp47/JayE
VVYPVPSPSEIARRAHAALRSELPGTDALVRPNNLNVIGKVWGLILHEVHLRAAWIYRQCFASSADGEHLERRHAAEYGLARLPASRATGTLSGTATPSTTFPAGIRFLAGPVAFVSTAAATSSASSDGAITVPVQAETAGAAGNLDVGAPITLADPGAFLDLEPELTVATMGGGADRESDEDLRARVLDRKRRPPGGGSLTDYEQWAEAVPGVTRAFAAQPENGPGSVVLWFLFEGRANGIPNSGDVAAVQADLDTRRRITTAVYVEAPVAQPVPITITGLTPDTAAVRAAVASAIAAVFSERAEVGRPGASFVFSRSWIAEAVSAAVGEDRHVLTLPSADVTATAGRYPVPGTITYA